jgi:hypothetical protein
VYAKSALQSHMPRNRALTPSVYSAVLFRFRWPSTPDLPGFSTLHGKHVTASIAEPMRMNVLHPYPIGRNRQLTGKPIGRHLRPALRRENPLVGFTIAVERRGRRCLFVEGELPQIEIDLRSAIDEIESLRIVSR